jgi:hypothetical protein
MGGLTLARFLGLGGMLLWWLLSLMACSPSATSTNQSSDTLTIQPGGWTVADPFNQDVQEAARFAVQTQSMRTHSRLIYKDLKSAQTQVVAGQNFQMNLTIIDHGLSRSAAVSVWKDLHNQYSLTHWQWSQDALAVTASP